MLFFARNTPYSFTFSFLSIPKDLILMLWALEPVK